jgi:hypothetical protein
MKGAVSIGCKLVSSEPYPKLVMVIKPNDFYKDRHDLVPLLAPTSSLKALAKILPKSGATYPRKSRAVPRF